MTKVLLLFLLLISQTAFQDLRAQLPTSESTEKHCNFSEVYREQGWTIPGASGAVPKGDRLTLSNIPGVFVTEMNAGKSDLSLMLFACPQDFPGRLTVRTSPVRVLAMSKFDFKGRVYAYAAQYEPQVVVNGSPQRSLGFVQVIFYDVDGAGLFKVMKFEYLHLLQAVEPPEWTKKPPQ
jgi:hypothetical protein